MSGGVFISYRREDSAGFAGRIYDRLTRRMDPTSVFLDVDNIPPGMDFVDVLTERVGACDALIAVIGRSWLASTGKDNRRRLDDPNDFVRIEIEAALARGVRVIPVLVDGATMPKSEELPQSLKKLVRRQGIEVSHTRFESDAERLIRAVSFLEEEARHEAVAERKAREQSEKRGVAARAWRSQAEPAEAANQMPAQAPRTGLVRKQVARPSGGWFRRAILAVVGAIVVGAAVLLPREFELGPLLETSPQSQYGMGNNYFHGMGTFSRDYSQAFYWYQKAADRGNADAQFKLGLLYEDGLGVTKDYGQAKVWYQKAADQGNSDAAAGLFRIGADPAVLKGSPTDLSRQKLDALINKNMRPFAPAPKE